MNSGMLFCERGSLFIFTTDRDEFLSPGNIIIHAWLIKEKNKCCRKFILILEGGKGPILGLRDISLSPRSSP